MVSTCPNYVRHAWPTLKSRPDRVAIDGDTVGRLGSSTLLPSAIEREDTDEDVRRLGAGVAQALASAVNRTEKCPFAELPRYYLSAAQSEGHRFITHHYLSLNGVDVVNTNSSHSRPSRPARPRFARILRYLQSGRRTHLRAGNGFGMHLSSWEKGPCVARPSLHHYQTFREVALTAGSIAKDSNSSKLPVPPGRLQAWIWTFESASVGTYVLVPKTGHENKRKTRSIPLLQGRFYAVGFQQPDPMATRS